ncbi:hypothetical protein [Glutamicibacter nicotianae]|uniref:hypothetical protein n=1 Tax=Glutamicibacter nicotianae TaxID=37929 RepID=UPI00167FD4B8|nr:hypothetical protein [Glutamicibacter nicotianae]
MATPNCSPLPSISLLTGSARWIGAAAKPPDELAGGDLLLLARLDEENAFKRSKIDLCSLTADITEDFKLTASDHHWEFDCQAPQTFVYGDSSSLRRVITNLLANARKHTTAGTPSPYRGPRRGRR